MLLNKISKSRSGFTLVEVIVSAFILSILFLSLAGAFSSNLMAVSTAKDLTNAAAFMESTMQSFSAQPYDNMLAMNGNQFFDNTDAIDSKYSINLAVFTSSVDLLQIRAVLMDLRTNQEIARVVTFRSKR